MIFCLDWLLWGLSGLFKTFFFPPTSPLKLSRKWTSYPWAFLLFWQKCLEMVLYYFLNDDDHAWCVSKQLAGWTSSQPLKSSRMDLVVGKSLECMVPSRLALVGSWSWCLLCKMREALTGLLLSQREGQGCSSLLLFSPLASSPWFPTCLFFFPLYSHHCHPLHSKMIVVWYLTNFSWFIVLFGYFSEVPHLLGASGSKLTNLIPVTMWFVRPSHHPGSYNVNIEDPFNISKHRTPSPKRKSCWTNKQEN